MTDVSAATSAALRRQLKGARGTEPWVGPYRAVLKGERPLDWLGEQVDDDVLPPVVVRALMEAWSPAARVAAAASRREHHHGLLPEDHGKYFEMNVKHFYGRDPVSVPLHKVQTIRARPEGIANARPLMKAAGEGQGGKRHPAILLKHPDGHHTVHDGNSTVAIARQEGWKTIPAIVAHSQADAEHVAEIQKREKKRSKGLSEMEMLSEKWTPAARLAALRARREHMHGMFSTAERASHGKADLLRQPVSDLSGVYKASRKVAPHHRRVLEGVGHELGGGLVDHDDVPNMRHRKVAFTGPMKTRKRALSKVRSELGGDAGRITDIVRGSVSVPHVDDIPHAVEVLRKHADANGFDIVKPKNRFHSEKGSRTSVGATELGYRDVNMLLRHRDSGTLSEVQVHAHPYILAKGEGGGHKAYVEHTELKRQHGTAPPDHVVRRLGELEDHQRKVYAGANTKAFSWKRLRGPRGRGNG